MTSIREWGRLAINTWSVVGIEWRLAHGSILRCAINKFHNGSTSGQLWINSNIKLSIVFSIKVARDVRCLLASGGTHPLLLAGVDSVLAGRVDN